MKLIVCFPLLDLRYFLQAREAPGRPGWTSEQFRTIGSLGKVLCTVRDNKAGAAADVSPALLFRPEFSKTLRKGRSRSLACPKLDSGAEVLGRRLFADTHGHVRLEVLVDSADADFAGPFDMLETLLDETVEVPRKDFEPLALAGRLFAQLYLDQSAKTAPPWPESLPDRLLREGLGSPFAVVLMEGEPTAEEGTPLAGGSSLFPDVRHGSVGLFGTEVAGWILRHPVGVPSGWLDHVRMLCRILCALREVRLLTALDAAQAAEPFHLDGVEVTRALQRNERYVRKTTYGGWPVQQVLALEDRLSRPAAPLAPPKDPALRRDVLRSVESSLAEVGEASDALPDVPSVKGAKMGLEYDDIERLVAILRDEALNSGNPRAYFAARLRATEFGTRFRAEALALLDRSVDADDMARSLVQWSDNKGTNPENKCYATLGSLLRTVLPALGLESATAVSVIIVRYRLYQDQKLLDDLRARFQVPHMLARTARETTTDHGPDFEWQAPVTDGELQGFLPEPPLMDVGFLIRAVEASRSVCLVSVADLGRSGTGFLVGDRIVLTNHHVLFPEGAPADAAARAQAVSLRFGSYSAEGQDSVQSFRLAGDTPILAASPASALDYVLLKAEDELAFAPGLRKAGLDPAVPALGAAFHTLQHPGGGTMKLAVSENAVKFVDPARGIAQYATRTGQGSSGAPCFTADWKVAALHHAERARWNGAIREGILMENILPEIAVHLG